MSKSPDYHRSTVDRTLMLRARGDLRVVEVAFGGESTYIVTDPVSGEQFQFTAEEQALLVALRRPVSLRNLQRVIEEQFPPRRVRVLELQQFLNRLFEQGLLVSDSPGQGSELHKRGREQRRRERRGSWLQLLSVRVARFQPGRLIDSLYGLVGWMCSRPAVTVAAVAATASLAAAIGNATELAARLPNAGQLLEPRLWPVWLAAIIGVKAVHELGHAVACRHFGARPQEMGVLLLAGAPTLYCDVSDAWRLPIKWQRMAVSSAGMFVELMIAAAALLAWRYSEPGLVSAVCLSLLMVCSVGTLVINANPLLRYDGYYLLSDWLEVPNLAGRARGLITGAWRSWLLGEPVVDDPLLGRGKRRALWIYAVLSKLYMALVLAGLLVLFLKIARPYHLENAVYTLAAIVMAGILARPVATAVKLAGNPLARARFRWLRLIAATAMLAGIGAAALLIPVTRRVRAQLVLIPAQSTPAFAVAAGELVFALPAGASVNQGDVIARLANPDLELLAREQEGVVRQQQLHVEQLRTLQAVLPGAGAQLPTAMAKLADAQAQLAERQGMIELLTIRAPAAGRLVAPPRREPPSEEQGKLRTWAGTPLDAKNLGAWIEPGTPIAVVANEKDWIAWAAVEQADVAAVEVDQEVRMVAEPAPLKVLSGKVRNVARRARSNEADGTRAEANRSSAFGDARYHVVTIEVDAAEAAPLLPGARDSAKIATYDSTVGKLLVDQLRRTFRRVF